MTLYNVDVVKAEFDRWYRYPAFKEMLRENERKDSMLARDVNCLRSTQKLKSDEEMSAASRRSAARRQTTCAVEAAAVGVTK